MRKRSAFRITTDLLFYMLILALLLPFSRKPLATGLNRLVMHRPAVIRESRQQKLNREDYEWVLADMDGNPVPFRSFKGKAVFLSIWATWCPPCRAEMPNIQRLYQAYGDRLEMVLASQEDPGTIRDFMERYGYDVPVYRLVQNPPEKLSASSIPTTFLITEEGRIAVRKEGSAKWDGRYFRSFLDSILED